MIGADEMHKTRLDREKVVRAAAEMLNEEGAEALTLGRLAEKLGIQTPSLYNHIDGLGGLQHELAILNARRLGERLSAAAIGQAGGPGVMALAQAYRAYIKENPGLYLASLRASGTRPEPDAELTAAEEGVLRVVTAEIGSFGLSGEDGLHAVRGLRSVVHGFATLEIAGGFGLALDCDESFRRLVEMLVRGMVK
jgi:AcrR family transcriptional regulator